ncbi:oxysterol-binding protein homolog 6 [[Candida] jaroonii]|uniref:Oxysterol-binding protein homolog 6 n=1 Tax=[Candida] jaroonii TaxID=467808 RepID=A0ACA9Y1K2_9ASCO|nr:oxysterol-binding protein homolog 6 [[Candida] jaroonii]
MGLTSKLDKLKLKSSSDEKVDKPAKMDNNSSTNTNTSSNSIEDNTDDIDELDNEGQSILMGIISQLRPGMDLTKITLPTFILEKKSMLERITNFFQIPGILLEANDEDDELKRFLLMVKWYLASWHIAPKAVKKPLNPVLGEVFTCYWDNLPEDKKAYYISEQTSHHPPKSSYFYLIPESKIRVDGIVIPKSKFLGNSSAAMMEGWGHVTLGERDNELYLMNQPNVYCRGILFGKLRYELGDHMYVKCPTTGYEADIEFKTKGFISGTYDAIEGTIKNKDGDLLYNISGKWNDVMEIKDTKTGKKEVFFDVKSCTKSKPQVKPLDEQWDFESQKLWKDTIDALSDRNHELATAAKSKVEDSQRQLAKKRVEDGVSFHPRLFHEVNDDDKLNQDLEYLLYKHLDLSDDAETLEQKLFQVLPILPGQEFDDKFHIPAFKKKSSS